MQLTSVLIDGEECIGRCKFGEVEITSETGGSISTASLVIADATLGAVVGTAIVGLSLVGGSAPVSQSEILIYSGATRIFGGYVTRIAPYQEAPGITRYRLDCQDWTRLLDTVAIELESFTAQTDEQILDYLFSTYLPAISTAGVVAQGTIDSLVLEDVSLRDAIARIVDRTGADYYIDPDKVLQYYAPDANAAAFGLAESPDNSTTFPFQRQGATYEEDGAALVNSVVVAGAGGSTTTSNTTYNPGATGDDGHIRRYATFSWPPDAGTLDLDTSGSEIRVACSKYSTYEISVGMIRFDTSAIPDGATINSATLSLYINDASIASGDTGREFGADYFANSNWPIDSSDYTSSPPSSPTAFAWIPLFALLYGQYVDFPLLTPSTINVTGYTGFRLYVRTTSTPTVQNWVKIDSYESSNKPKLQVSYTVTVAGVEGAASDPTSITIYGLIERKIIDRSILTDAEADLRAQIEVARYSSPQLTAALDFRRDGLTVGDYVPISAPSLGLIRSLPLRRLRAKWETQSLTTYSGEFGDYRPDLMKLLRRI